MKNIKRAVEFLKESVRHLRQANVFLAITVLAVVVGIIRGEMPEIAYITVIMGVGSSIVGAIYHVGGVLLMQRIDE
jgi:hypothetical protein